MQEIPVTFEHEGKQYTGYFSEVNGAGSAGNWHLTINKRYYGQMFTTADGLRFYSQKGDLDYLADYFIAVVMAWYQ